MSKGFAFRESDHTFWTTGGDPIPGVSAILKDNGFVDDRWYKAQHATRGHYVHHICRFIEEGTLDVKTVDDRLKGYVEACQAFKAEYKGLRTVKTRLEKPVYNALSGYAGIPDSVPNTIVGRAILDWKSGQPQDWHMVQIAGYANLYTPTVATRLIVYLKKNGTYKLHEDNRREYHDQIFLSALNCYKWRHKNDK